MRYQIDKENYHRFEIMEKNKLPPRSYLIPYETRLQCDQTPLLQKRYASPKVRCLNGEWDFKFYPQPTMLPDVVDTEKMSFDTIDVPSCWQFRGYAKPFYVNIRYQFPYDPPKIPTLDPVGKTFCYMGVDKGIYPRWQQPKEEYNYVGMYRKKLEIRDLTKNRILSFLGVASCLDLYVNGQFVGYSEGSHNPAEFSVSPFLREGENELLVLVRRWCTGTYLECQDMFRNNGIFRDVLLYELDPVDIWDVAFSCRKEEKGYRACVQVELTGDGEVSVALSGPGVEEQATVTAQNGKAEVVFENLQPKEWNGEAPTLYDLYVSLPNSCVKQRVGFKTVAIEKDVYTLNGSKIKFRGVNHHDTSPTNGYTLTPEEILRDVKLCKKFNIDTIRTSHYPPDPLLLELCDELGLYVVDEGDLETHGTFAMQLPPTYNSISHDPKWENRYLDRVKRLYGRDKNHACIILWSLGNEAGGYRNTDAMYRYLKERTSIPVHYESAIHCKRIAYDVGSEMYPSVDMVRQVGEHSRREKPLNDRPYFLCEYAHAMGVGPGAMDEYWQVIYGHDNLMGGCVWEMVDHAVLHPDGRYTYGGDHGEWEHDGNFCVDGIFYPDRTPSTGAKIVRHVYRPIRVRHLGGDRYEVFNTMAFTPSSAYSLIFTFSDGTVVTQALPEVPPLTRRDLSIPGCGPKGNWVTVRAVRLADGEEVSREQILFSLPVVTNLELLPGAPEGLEWKDGKLHYTRDGKVLTASDQHTILFRAPTDNDTDALMRNTIGEFLSQKEEITQVTVEKDKLVMVSVLHCGWQAYRCTDTYEKVPEGILVTSKLHCLRGTGDLPRFGKAYRLDGSFQQVRYLGRNGESYCDMKEQAQIEQVSCGVWDMVEPNIRPQESGNRSDCVWAEVSDGQTAFRFTAVDRPFELGIKPYSDWELLSMKHREDEKQSGTYLTVSAFQRGIGTGSCGPVTLKKYRYPANREYTLRFILR